MKVIAYTTYGPPDDVLKLIEVEKPTPKNSEVLVKICAASVNFNDSAFVRGKPFLSRLWIGFLKPKHQVLGTDIAGQVEAVSRNVTQFQPGDEVFGEIGNYGYGAFAEYVCVHEYALALKPVNITYEEAAAVPQAAVTALQGLRDKGQIQEGQKVLINGASGGIGTFAVQIAKYYGAEVTGVCSTNHLDMLRSIGADYVIDYTREDFTQNEQRFDLILDIVANRSTSDLMRALNPKGTYVAVAFSLNTLLLGSMLSKTEGKTASSLAAKSNVKDLAFMAELIESGKVVPVIDRCYLLSDAAEAFRHYREGAQGKVVITMEHNN